MEQLVPHVSTTDGLPTFRLKTAGWMLVTAAVALLTPFSPGQAVPPVFQVTAPEISLDLVVHDKKNRSVTDLKPEEITVTDNGSRMTLTRLRLVTGRSESKHLVTLLFDPLEADKRKDARKIALKILKMVPEESFLFAVLQVQSRLRLQQGYSADRKSVEQAVDGVTGETSGSFDQAEKTLVLVAQTGEDPSGSAAPAYDRTLAQTLLSAIEASGQMVRDQHASPYLAGLLALTQSQQPLHEQKAIIYFAHSRQIDANGRELIGSIIGAANRSGISVYVIDLDAIDRRTHEEFAQNVSLVGSNPGTVHGATGSQKLPPPSQVFTDDARTSGDTADPAKEKSPIQILSEATGGTYVSSEDSLKKPPAEMVQDMTTYYEASYVPRIENYDGKFRQVEVLPLRKGLRIRANAGYFAIPPDAGIGVRGFEMPLLKILREPNLPTELAFQAKVLKIGELPSHPGYMLSIEAPLSDADILRDANTNLYSLHLSVVAQIKDKTGRVVEHFSEDLPRRGTLETLDKVKSEYVTVQKPFDTLPGEYVLEVAILDRNSGKAGAHRIDFKIPATLPQPDSDHNQNVDLSPPQIEPRSTGTLAITFPNGAAQPPSANEIEPILQGATRQAINYSALLPNFVCLEVTNRSVDAKGDGKWKHQDKVTELLTYQDQAENRTMVEVDALGKKSHITREDLQGWLSHGEFGGVLKSVFQSSSQTEFHWTQTGEAADGPIQVFEYRVSRKNSNFDIHWGMQVAMVGFHGEVFLETATRSVRRITLVADDVPPTFPIHSVSMSVDYDYVLINNHEYLLPVDGQVKLRQGRRQAILNEIEFRNYRRFGSTARILDYSVVEAP